MKITRVILVLSWVLQAGISFSQTTFPTNGAPNNGELMYAFTHATIYTSSTDSITGALLIQGQNILAVGDEVVIPDEAIQIDIRGKNIYPSFIDTYTTYGIAKQHNNKKPKRGPQYNSSKKGAYGWNEHVLPELDAVEIFSHDSKKAAPWIQSGFGTVGSHIESGLMTGTGMATTLADKNENTTLLALQCTDHLSFDRSNAKQSYPNSLMGKIALLRQTYYDAQWYGAQERDEKNLSLEAVNKHRLLTQIFSCHNKYDVLRADKIGDEFGIQFVFKGTGDEYQRIDEIRETHGWLIIPLNFPDAYEVDDYYKTLDLSLEDMQHWKWAAYNPSILEKNGMDFAFTMDGLEKPEMFLPNLRKAVQMGLSKQKALQSLFETPAQILNIQEKVGSIEEGKLANFIICSGDLFDPKTKINEHWIQGERHRLSPLTEDDISGQYSLQIDKESYDLEVAKSGPSYEAKIVWSEAEKEPIPVTLSLTKKRVDISLPLEDHLVRLSGVVNDRNNLWNGNGTIDANDIKWHAILKEISKKKEESKPDSAMVKTAIQPIAIQHPLGGYGWDSLPTPQTILFRRARVWTNEAEGIIEDCDVLIHNGKILAVGQNLKVLDILPTDVKYQTVIAKNMDITAGIIDEHSHIAIERGVNEGGQASSAEVRIGDVINADDINIYRQLAGGVTTSQLLHGSANPIGGQSAIIKLRWGQSPESMKFEGADPTIKFALGENVKQSNWGDLNTIRFPQTRMGVEQLYYDHFYRAKAYGEAWKKIKKPDATTLTQKKRKNKKPLLIGKKKKTLRMDLELEALDEILDEKRFITCHSYSQSEINMLMNVADSMGFRVNTFTHILEGYKLADKLKDHGAMASTFSDWWAYKFEVNDAIPYNAALMHDRGITVGINSDDAEMGRRLNQEAAKVVKYGGVSEEEALKMVTLNPAKMLHIDDRVGSIKVGKDADLVLWTGNPLSIYSKVDRTYIDGALYYSQILDAMLRENIKKQRASLIKEMKHQAGTGATTQKAIKKTNKYYHCDDLEEQ